MTPHCKTPCKTCPWRKNSDDTQIPGFDLPKTERLRKTCVQGFGGLMACHLSPEDAPVVCAGYLQSDSARNSFIWRLEVLKGDLPDSPLNPDCFNTFDEMDNHHGWSTRRGDANA